MTVKKFYKCGMLVLARLEGESVTIGSKTVLTVKEVSNRDVMLRIQGIERVQLAIRNALEEVGKEYFFESDASGAPTFIFYPEERITFYGVEIVLVEIEKYGRECRARLGFTAPHLIPIHRQEVFDRIHNG